MTILVIAFLAYAASWLVIAAIDVHSRREAPAARRSFEVPATESMREAA